MKIQPWKAVQNKDLADVVGVCLDIDDTLSTRGKLTSEAYDALWRLKAAGFGVVPITGRPAGWCDHVARFWPVDAVVGENGAFTFYMDQGVRKRIETPAGVSAERLKEQLRTLEARVRERFPHARWASDQSYREFDLAIDICEDVPPWKAADVESLLELCRGMGAHAKLSSIHVNTWFGDYDKRKGWDHAVGAGILSKKLARGSWLFIGDSPNDEPMFAAFEHSVGVANLKRYTAGLKHPPRWMTRSVSGAGFVEMADRLIRSRRSKGRAR